MIVLKNVIYSQMYEKLIILDLYDISYYVYRGLYCHLWNARDECCCIDLLYFLGCLDQIRNLQLILTGVQNYQILEIRDESNQCVLETDSLIDILQEIYPRENVIL